MKKHYVFNGPFKMKDKEGVEYTLKVEQDCDPETPREWSNTCTMVCWHTRYSLGDKHPFDTMYDFFERLCYEILHKDDNEIYELTCEDMFKMLNESNLVLIKPINMYDHSGITVSTSNDYPYNDRWDAGCVGFIYVTKKKLFEECIGMVEETWKEQADKYIEGEMEIYDQYVRGEVYGFTLTKKVTVQEKCPHCGEIIREYEDEVVEDSCWGFYGDCLEDNGILDNISSELSFVE